MNQNKATEANEVVYIEDLGVTDRHFTTATELVDYLLKAKKITEETIGKYDIGTGLFNELIIPCSGAEQIFNADALLMAKDKPIVITDSAIDAMSIEQCGGSAIAIKDRNYKALLNAIKGAKAENKAYVICFGNDESKTEKAERCRAELKKRKIESNAVNIAGEYNTINEALQNNERGLSAEISLLSNKEELYLKENAASRHLSKVSNYLNPAETPFISTGFDRLDDALDGGLYPGFYILAAITGLGKTAFIQQIMDNIAKNGTDVLMFALEMSEEELIARSLSRLTFINSKEREKAKTVRGILNGGIYRREKKKIEAFPKDEQDLISQSGADYMSFAEHIFIEEGIGNIGYKEIEERVSRHIAITRHKPVVIIDYLQILQLSEDSRKTDKQNMDKAVLSIKRLSRDFGIPIIAISSLNRLNYNEEINLAALKESGAIEYSADAVLGLQLDLKTFNEDTISNAMDTTQRKLLVKILKNRNGRSRAEFPLFYYPAFNFFEERTDVVFTEDRSNTEIPFKEPKAEKKPSREMKINGF